MGYTYDIIVLCLSYNTTVTDIILQKLELLIEFYMFIRKKKMFTFFFCGFEQRNIEIESAQYKVLKKHELKPDHTAN